MKFLRVCRRHLAIGGAALALAGSGCVSEPSAVTGQKRAYGYSWQQELQLGEQTDTQITEQMGLYEDAAMQQYVETIGRRVVETSDFRSPDTPELYRDTQFTFRVLDSPVVNAFALPGGYVYVTRGLLTHLQNEAQLAVVLGHEVAHVTARHASQQALRSQFGQLGLFAGAILGQHVLGGQGGDIAGNILQLGGGALQLLMFRYSREAEHESDTLGVRYAAQAGYAAAEGAHFFRTLERMAAQEGRALPSWSSTHPDPGDRRERILALSSQWRPIGDRPPVVNEGEYLGRMDGMILGENPREGFREGDVFLHPELGFQFTIPSGWRMQNERAIVLMGEPNGRAMLGFELVPAASPREAAQRLAQQEGLQVASAQDLLINGLPATTVLAQATTPQGALGIVATFLQDGNRVYSFLGYAPAPVFAQYRPIFQGVASGFSRVTNPAVLQVQPARVQVVTLPREMSFREIVPSVLPPGLSAEELAIINQVEMDDRLPAGRRVKLPTAVAGARPVGFR